MKIARRGSSRDQRSQGELFSQRALALLWDGARDPTVNTPQREGEAVPGPPGECLAQMRKEICVGLLVIDTNDFMSRTPPKELGDGCTVRIGEQCNHRTEVEAKPGDACGVDTLRASVIISLMNQRIMLVAVDVVIFGKDDVSTDCDSESVSEEVQPPVFGGTSFPRDLIDEMRQVSLDITASSIRNLRSIIKSQGDLDLDDDITIWVDIRMRPRAEPCSIDCVLDTFEREFFGHTTVLSV